MLGSSQSVAGPNVALNTIMAEELGQFADILEKADDFDSALQKLVCDTLKSHQRIIFNGNGYSDAWREEAAQRGLHNLSSTAEALPAYISEKNIDLVTKRGIFSEEEFRARHEIHMEAYCKVINIEARTALDMAIQQILPAAVHYSSDLALAVQRKRDLNIPASAEASLLTGLAEHTDSLYAACEQIRTDLENVPKEDTQTAMIYFRNVIVNDMNTIRFHADTLEQLTDKSYWPYPTYSDILFY